MFDAHVYAYYRAPYRMVMLSRWPPWQTGKWVNPARICGEERPTSLYAIFPLSSPCFQFFLSLSLLPSNFFTRLLYLPLLNHLTTNVHLNVILFFISYASYTYNFARWFLLLRRFESYFDKNIRKRTAYVPVERTLRFHQLFREKKITREVARYINLDAIDVLLVTIPEDIPFPRMGPRVWRRSISYFCAA